MAWLAKIAILKSYFVTCPRCQLKRQAKHLHMRTIQLVEDARSEACEHAAAAWAQLSASRTKLNSTQAQVEASKVALSGVREEEQVGQRTLRL